MGTWDYMAPEQARDSHLVDIRADIYSLGCTFYKLLAGRSPFPSPLYKSPRDKARAHQVEPPPPLSFSRSDVPEAVQAVVSRMLAKDPDDRYQTPAEVAQALAEFVVSSDLSGLAFDEARPAGRISTTWKNRSGVPGEPSRALRTFALAAALLLFGLVGVGSYHLVSQWLAAEPSEREVGVWHALLRRAPLPLRWDRDQTPPAWNAGSETLTADAAEEFGILGLVKPPPQDENLLEIEFRAGKDECLTRVRFADQELHDLCSRVLADPKNLDTPEMFEGHVGVFVINTLATFRDARIMYLDQ
jgi:hypothetical protein